jgi:hypothetical protein
MPVILDSKKIIPGPFVRITNDIKRSEDGSVRQAGFNISVKGKLTAFKGSPDSTGAFWTASGYPPDETIPIDSRLASLRNKQGALCNLFAIEGKLFEIQPYDGSAPIKFNATLLGIDFDEGNWVEYVNYTVNLHANSIWFGAIECKGTAGNAASFTDLPEESWSVEQEDEGRAYRFSHTVTSTQKKTFDSAGALLKKGWENARDVVVTKLGIDKSVITSTPASGWGAYNYLRSEQIDEAGGKYSVTENWLLYDEAKTDGVPCVEEYEVTTRTTEDGRTSVTINGTLKGLDVKDNTTGAFISGKYSNAALRYGILEPELYAIASASAGTTLNGSPVSNQIGKNFNTGVISFNREYNDRPVIIAGATSATIQVNDKRPSQVFATHVVPGKAAGPVLQDIFTKTAKQRSLAIEAALSVATISFTPTKPDTDGIVATYFPGGFVDRDEENWSPHTGRYSRQVGWTYV